MRRIGLILLALIGAGAVALAQGPLTPVAPAVNTVYQARDPIVPRRVVIDHDGTDQVVINESAGQQICVLAGSLTMTGTAVSIRFESTGGGTALTGQMTPTSGQTITWPFNPACWIKSLTGSAINLELGGAQSVDGVLVYAFIDP